MTVTIQSAYTLTDGTNARIVHAGIVPQVKTVTASAELADYPGAAVLGGDTVDKWRPFANALTSQSDFATGWTATAVTVGSDGLTIAETTATSQHDLSQAFTFTAVEHITAFKVSRQTVPEVQVRANDGTTSFTCFFDLRDGTVGTAANCVGQIRDLGDGEYLVSIYYTPLAATGVVEVLLADGSEGVSYTGAVANTVKLIAAYTHASEATLRFDLFTAVSCDAFALAAHNLGLGAARVTWEHDSNDDDTWTALGTTTATDNSPMLFLHSGVTSSRWRVTIDRGVLPEISVMRVCPALVMMRPFYGGFTPARMNRATEVLGNLSGSGQLLGRSVKRTVLASQYQWANLTYAWVRANLDLPGGLIQSIETDGAFVAWRPSVTQDVDYVMRGSSTPPQTTGQADRMGFSMSGEVHSYE